MIFAGRTFYIDCGTSYQGIIRFGVEKKFDDFFINLEFFELKNIDIKNIVQQFCLENRNKYAKLERFDLKIKSSAMITFDDIEAYSKDFKLLCNDLYIKSHGNLDNLYKVKLFNNKISLILSLNQLKKLYLDLESFKSNYFMFDVMYGMIQSITTADKYGQTLKLTDKISEINVLQNNNQQIQSPPPVVDTHIPTNPVVVTGDNPHVTQDSNQSPTSLDTGDVISQPIEDQFDIFNNATTLLNPIFSHLGMAMVIDYYRYLSSTQCYINSKDNDAVIVVSPSIFPSSMQFSNNILITFINSTDTIMTNEIKFIYTKLLTCLKNKIFTSPILIMLSLYILILHAMVLMNRTNNDVFESMKFDILSSSKFQIKLLNHYIKTYYSDFENLIDFDISDIDINLISESNINQSDVQKISEKYSHIKLVDDNLFINTILNDLNSLDATTDADNSDLKLLMNNRHSISLTSYIKTPLSKDMDNIIIVDPADDNNIDPLFSLEYNDESNEFYSSYYTLFISYLDSDNFIVKKHESKLNTEIINLFPDISGFITNHHHILETYDLFLYYMELKKYVSSLSSIQNNVESMYIIIWQILIPYISNKTGNRDFISF